MLKEEELTIVIAVQPDPAESTIAIAARIVRVEPTVKAEVQPSELTMMIATQAKFPTLLKESYERELLLEKPEEKSPRKQNRGDMEDIDRRTSR